VPPVTVHAYIEPVVGVIEYKLIELAHTVALPVIALVVGNGLIVTVLITAAPTQLYVFVSITCTVPDVPAPQVTVIEVPVPLVGVPPVTVQA
jgi:hypothetical protein